MITAYVPQVFGDTPISITDVIGGLPDGPTNGWVMFESGWPEFPVWSSGVVTGGGPYVPPVDEVWVNTEEPTDPNIEIWYDPDAVVPALDYITRTEAHAQFLTMGEADAAFMTPAEADAAFLTPAEGNAAYLAVAQAQVLTPTGSLVVFAGVAAPTGWLMCNGVVVSRTTYAALFGVISTTYNTGGEAGTDFRLPDLLGRVPVGRDAGQTEFDTLGETGGAKTQALTIAQLPSHSHGGNTAGHNTNHTHQAPYISGDFPGSTQPSGFGVGAATISQSGQWAASSGGANVDHVHAITAEGSGHRSQQPPALHRHELHHQDLMHDLTSRRARGRCGSPGAGWGPRLRMVIPPPGNRRSPVVPAWRPPPPT